MKNVAIVMGGYSSEYKISLTSGNVVFNQLDKTKYNLFRIHILPEKWVYVDEKDNEFPVNKHDFSVTIDGKTTFFDVVFNAIHGTPGEDGLLQAYFQLLGIPQTSCDYYQAALTFNKRDLLSVLKPYGIKTATSFYLNLGDNINLEEIISKLEGQLTGTILAEKDEIKSYTTIVSLLQNRVGRIIFNGVPTGVEVCAAMVHGGPYPASTDSRFTAVGINSIKRWVRPFSFQSWPNELLPNELKNENPLGILRVVDGVQTSKNL